jgi:hypothetical protein
MSMVVVRMVHVSVYELMAGTEDTTGNLPVFFHKGFAGLYQLHEW